MAQETGRTTDKQFDIENFQHFIEAIKLHGHDTYFDGLVEAANLICRNISDDIDPFVGVYESVEICEQVINQRDDRIAGFLEEIRDLQAHDVRMLKRQRTANLKALADIQAELNRIDSLMS